MVMVVRYSIVKLFPKTLKLLYVGSIFYKDHTWCVLEVPYLNTNLGVQVLFEQISRTIFGLDRLLLMSSTEYNISYRSSQKCGRVTKPHTPVKPSRSIINGDPTTSRSVRQQWSDQNHPEIATPGVKGEDSGMPGTTLFRGGRGGGPG